MSKSSDQDEKLLQRLQELKALLRNKQETQNEFKQRYKIDFDVLLDPEHPNFGQTYSFEDPKQENLVLAIKLKMGQRNVNAVGAFTVYHLAKTVLWRYGYGATFFYRTRFLTIPVLFFTVWYNIFRRYPNDLRYAKVFEYTQRKVRFEKDMYVV